MDTELLALWPAAIAFIGIVVGALLNYMFQKSQKRNELSISEKQRTYSSFLECLGDYGIHSRDDSGAATLIEKRAKLTAAKAKVCVYGSHQVLKQLGEFDHRGSNLSDPATQMVFINLIDAMRADAGLSSNRADIDRVLLGGSAYGKKS
jgi:hypothetical protein